MAGDLSAQRPPAISSRSSSLDKAKRLIGQLDSNGIASLKVETNLENGYTKVNPPRSMKTALDTVTNTKRGKEDSDTGSTASEEDYDTLGHDPLTMVAGGKGGSIEDVALEGREETKAAPGVVQSRPRPITGLKSIPITLQEADQKGKYFLIADDAELKKILKMGFEREEGSQHKKRRTKFSDLVFTRQFTAFDSQNSESAESPFHGFFTLFWLGTAIFMIQTAAKNWQEHGNVLGTNDIMKIMIHHDLIVLGLSDGVMVAATSFGWLHQQLILKGYISWNKAGWVIQSIWQLFFISSVIAWTLFREWLWTHTVFFFLHGLVMLMKQHSYAFYNGYLSEALKSKNHLETHLKQLQDTKPVKSPSGNRPAVSSFTTSYLDHQPTASELNHRRHHNEVDEIQERSSDIAQIAAAIETDEPLDLEQIQLFERILKWEINVLSENLKGRASKASAHYPNNLTMANHFEFIVLPTLVYELEYPRSDEINWYYVAEKVASTAGVLFIMMLVSQSFIYPVVMRTVEMKASGMPLYQRLEAFPWILSDLIFPFMMEYMMAWWIIWESILNLLAELTYFADRGFYADWWNSVSWDQFSRDWNRPVHNFLLRHVYHSSISSMKVNKGTATLITFFLSACVHELIMWCLFKKLRGYLLFMQMSQLPLVQLSRTRFLKHRSTLGNLIFWIGIFTGPSLLCSLYLII